MIKFVLRTVFLSMSNVCFFLARGTLWISKILRNSGNIVKQDLYRDITIQLILGWGIINPIIQGRELDYEFISWALFIMMGMVCYHFGQSLNFSKK